MSFLTANKSENALLLARVGKLYGKSPAIDYLGLTDPYLIIAVDLACAAAHWEDENQAYKTSNKTAGKEAVDIGRVLDQYRQQLNERG